VDHAVKKRSDAWMQCEARRRDKIATNSSSVIAGDSSTFQDGGHQDICDVPVRPLHALRRGGFRGGCLDWALHPDASVTSRGAASGRCGV